MTDLSFQRQGAGTRVPVTLPGCGHIPMWDGPQLVTDLLPATAGAAP